MQTFTLVNYNQKNTVNLKRGIKLLLDVEFIQEPGMKCIDMALSMAAKLYKKDYELMFSDSWSFYFNNMNLVNENNYDPFAEKILVGNVNFIKNFEKYHGINVLNNRNIDAKNYFNLIIENIQLKTPVALWYDQFYMPWTKEIRKKAPLRYDGFMMIIGFDHKNKEFICIDVHGTQKIERLPYSTFGSFVESKTDHYCVVFRNKEDEIDIKFSEHIDECLNRLYDKSNRNLNIFEQMKECSYYIKESFDLKKEIEYTYKYESQLSAPTHIYCMKSFIEIARMRNLYSLCLKYFYNKSNDFRVMNLSNEFKLFSTNWQTIVSVLVKSYYRSDYNNLNNIISKYINNIADQEEKLAESLQIIDWNKSINYSKSINEIKKEKYFSSFGLSSYQLNLELYFNNKGIARYINEIADFDGLGNYLIMDDAKECLIKDTNINFPYKLSFGDKDNLICKNQIIHTRIGKYVGLSILGACDSGAFYGQLDVIHENNKTSLVFGLGEWRFNKCQFNENVAWIGDRVYLKKVNPEEKAYLFSKVILFEKELDIEQIILPNCTNMHIFAINLLFK